MPMSVQPLTWSEASGRENALPRMRAITATASRESRRGEGGTACHRAWARERRDLDERKQRAEGGAERQRNGDPNWITHSARL
jgi:hypothetical protein